jgi:hypothetical protein
MLKEEALTLLSNRQGTGCAFELQPVFIALGIVTIGLSGRPLSSPWRVNVSPILLSGHPF